MVDCTPDMEWKASGKIAVKDFVRDYIVPQTTEFIDKYDLLLIGLKTFQQSREKVKGLEPRLWYWAVLKAISQKIYMKCLQLVCKQLIAFTVIGGQPGVPKCKPILEVFLDKIGFTDPSATIYGHKLRPGALIASFELTAFVFSSNHSFIFLQM